MFSYAIDHNCFGRAQEKFVYPELQAIGDLQTFLVFSQHPL